MDLDETKSSEDYSAVDARIELVLGDITQMDVEAVVNAANESLLGGGGVDGAIHRAAGPALLDECRRLGGCPTGEARITRGHDLPATYVIHTVGPVWQGGQENEAELLAKCYRSVFRIASAGGIGSLAFPCISCGVFAYPVEEAAAIALAEVRRGLRDEPGIIRVALVCYDEQCLAAYRRLLEPDGEQDGTQA